ncbi:MAG: glycosyltransferase [Kofleriaceae bacterium]
MKLACFYHSLISDWNHGNAHFLRGFVRELAVRGHDVRVFEPHDGWSMRNLVADHGDAAIAAFHAAYPELESHRYGNDLDLDRELDGVDAVLVHEWNDPALVARIGEHRARRGTGRNSYALLFHDTHHRSVTAPAEMSAYDLTHYDGVLAFGEVIRALYLQRNWARRAWTWHEAADVRVFVPQPTTARDGDVVWIGNWGDDERSTELTAMLIAPVLALGVRAKVFGVRYPAAAIAALQAARIRYGGWLPNFLAPSVFARHAVTIHVPRRPYVEALPGIPTIRVFEALACGIPLVSCAWQDTEQLFTPGRDYLVAHTGDEMQHHLRAVLNEPALAASLAAHAQTTIQARHTCAHRVDQLLSILKELA